jgi:beta-lactamase class D
MTLTTALLFLLALSRPGAHQTSNDRFAAAFTAAGVTGTCILYDLEDGIPIGHRPDRWDSAYIPASTFKIPNSLISLETGVIANEHTVIPWDSVQRPIAAWNQDHTMASAFKASTVWFYQELARRIGTQRMQHYLDTMAYGNRTRGGAIDEFWLDGGLRISPRQQVEFLVKLHRGALPFSATTMATVREIMVQERTDRYTLRAKTGWADSVTPGVGWYVGYVESGRRVVFFATEIDVRDRKDLPARAQVTRTILHQLGLID